MQMVAELRMPSDHGSRKMHMCNRAGGLSMLSGVRRFLHVAYFQGSKKKGVRKEKKSRALFTEDNF